MALFDMDGTIVPGTLAFDLLDELVICGACDPRQVDSVHRTVREVALLENGNVKAYAEYRKTVGQVGAHQMVEAASRCWVTSQKEVLHYVPTLMGILKRFGFLLVLISGSPQEIIKIAAAHLGFDKWCGASFGSSGADDILPAVGNGKKRALENLGLLHTIDWKNSFAIGNSHNDAELLDLVGMPLAFEPDGKLREVARVRNWIVADRHDVIAKSMLLLRRVR